MLSPFQVLAHKYVVLNENFVEIQKQQDKLTYQQDNNNHNIFSELDCWDRWRLAVTEFKLDDSSFRIADPNITSKYFKFFEILIGSCFEWDGVFECEQCCLSNPQKVGKTKPQFLIQKYSQFILAAFFEQLVSHIC